jgi:citrate lyase subunit beta/citryl-CoA lyase
MNQTVVRSVLILPVNSRRFVENAYRRGADAVMLDLEDSVPAAEKENARKLVKQAIPLAARGGGQVQVRVNSEPQQLVADIDAAVHPGLNSIVLPKVESAAQVKQVADRLDALERDRGFGSGKVKLSLVIESPKGLLELRQIALASSRIESMSLGPEDYCLALGVEPSADGIEILYPLSKVITISKAFGLRPFGLLGSIAGFKDLDGFGRAAERARQLGCEGGVCIHPAQVTVLNRVYSPDRDQVDQARRIIEAFKEGLDKGTASVDLDGRMIDLTVYRRAMTGFDRYRAIEELEERKAMALKRVNEKEKNDERGVEPG